MSGRNPTDPSADTDPRAARWLRRLCLFIVIASVAEFLIATIGVQVRRLPPSTDFASYYLAGALALDGQSPYDRTALAARGRALGFAYEQFPFLYPPPFAIAMQPLARLSYPRARQIWIVLGTLGLLGALAVTARLVQRQARALGLEDPRRVWILLAAFVPAALNSTSVHNDIRAGSVGILLYLMFALLASNLLRAPEPDGLQLSAKRAWGCDALVALALAVAVLAKLAPLVLVPYFYWRGSRRAAGLGIAFLAASMLPTLAHWGAGIVPDYLEHAVLPSLRDEVAHPMNHSLDAFLSRLFVPSTWVASPFDAPGLKRVLSAVLALALGGVTLRALVRPRPPAALLPVELGLLVLAMLALMKFTWVQTLCAMLFVWPVLMNAILRAAEREAPWARGAGLAACAGFFLSSAHVPLLWNALRHGPAVVATGVHLAGILVLWGVSLRVLARGAEFATDARASGTTTARRPSCGRQPAPE